MGISSLAVAAGIVASVRPDARGRNGRRHIIPIGRRNHPAFEAESVWNFAARIFCERQSRSKSDPSRVDQPFGPDALSSQ